MNFHSEWYQRWLELAPDRFTREELVARWYRGEQLDYRELQDVARIIKFSPAGC